MVAIAGSLYLASTLLFAVLALVVGVRLIRLSRRTGAMPERLLGAGVQLTACWGYGVMILSIVARNAAGAQEHPLGIAVTTFGWLAHDAGVICMLLFIRRVFRPEATWAGAAVGLLITLLVVGFIGNAWTGGLVSGGPTLWYWVGFVPIGLYPIWMSAESIAYGRRMGRRLRLDLADPHVVDRFRIWAWASACTAGAIWMVNVPSWLGVQMGQPEGSVITSISMLITAGFGIATVCLYWLTFFPPAWYRDRVEARAGV